MSDTSNRWIQLLLAGLVLARSAVFVFWEQSSIDSNQAVIGLMAKHVSELRAFSAFMYGQNYMLAVEAWLAAPLFAVAGPSLVALKLPLLAINLAVALLLLKLLQRESELTPALAAIAAVFFVVPPPGTAVHLLRPSGGIVEPLLYVLLLWVTRRHSVYFGLVLGIGFMHREFTIYGVVALLILATTHGEGLEKQYLRRQLEALCIAAAVCLSIQVLSRYGSAMGPGTTFADLPRPESVIAQLASRFAFDWRAWPDGFASIATLHWPMLFGTAVNPVRAFEVETNVVQGLDGLSIVLAAAMLWAVIRIAARLVNEREWHRDYDFCAYLVLVGILSVTGYVVGHGGVIDLPRMRYDMLSILGAVGLAGWYLIVERARPLRLAWVSLILVWALVGAAAHAQLLSEYLLNTPDGGKQRIVQALKAEGIRYGFAGYRDAYVIAFLSDEEIIFASTNRVRIQSYQREVEENRGEAIRIARRRCAGGYLGTPGIYFCPVVPSAESGEQPRPQVEPIRRRGNPARRIAGARASRRNYREKIFYPGNLQRRLDP